MPTLTSDMYHIKWTQLAELPVPLFEVYAAVHHHNIYVTGDGAVEADRHQVYVYNINTDQWGQLSPSGHYYGTPHIIGGRLAIIGGRLSTTKKRTNKVSTFDEDSQIWTSYYPDLLLVRSKPGIVSHLEYVIVAGGTRPTAEDDDTRVVQDDIEVLNWIENSHWRKVSIKLPVPMYGFTPTISDGDLLIVGYGGVDLRNKNVYKIPFTNIVASIDERRTYSICTSTKWTELTAVDHYFTALVPSSSPSVVVGGHDRIAIATADIKIYDNSNKSWKKIGSLSFARSMVAVAAIYDNAIVVIGGCTNGDGSARQSSSLTVVELGQAELLH